MTIDIVSARRETPGCKHVLHFNNAGAALMPEPVLRAVIGHLELEARIGGYEAAAVEAERIDRVYESLATLLNCNRNEIAFVENATRAWDMAFYSLTFGPGDRILTAMAEYASNYIPFLQVAEKTGARIEVIPDDKSGQLDIAALENMIDDKVKLIAITHVPTNGGLVNPAAAVGRIARAAGIPYLLDACQSVGQMPIDVAAIGCDMLSATGRKYLRGPRGTGFLYVRQSLIDKMKPPFLDLWSADWVAPDRYEIHPSARRFENWESNLAGKIGLGLAVDYALGWGLDAIYGRIGTLADRLRAGLDAMDGIQLRDKGVERCGIVTFTLDGRDPKALQSSLRTQDINVSHSTAPSTRLDMNARGLEAVVRASVHYYNDEQEVDRFLSAVEHIINK